MTTIADDIAAGVLPDRVWFYSNYHCNLSCTYCFTESTPRTPRMALPPEQVLELARQARALGYSRFGVTGGELDALVKARLGAPFFGVSLNPGHLIHLDEWMNSPVYPDSRETLRSGQALQLDIIPVELTQRQRIRLHIGTKEVMGRAVILDSDILEPGYKEKKGF